MHDEGRDSRPTPLAGRDARTQIEPHGIHEQGPQLAAGAQRHSAPASDARSAAAPVVSWNTASSVLPG